MTDIRISVDSCRSCPHFDTRNQWSSDGWDRMEDWWCTKTDKKIRGAVEWHEEKDIKIPEWCPIVITNKE